MMAASQVLVCAFFTTKKWTTGLFKTVQSGQKELCHSSTLKNVYKQPDIFCLLVFAFRLSMNMDNFLFVTFEQTKLFSLSLNEHLKTSNTLAACH